MKGEASTYGMPRCQQFVGFRNEGKAGWGQKEPGGRTDAQEPARWALSIMNDQLALGEKMKGEKRGRRKNRGEFCGLRPS